MVIKELVLDVSRGVFEYNRFRIVPGDKKIIMMTLFGKGYKKTPDSRQNIDVLYQGPMNFKRLSVKDGIPVYTITSKLIDFESLS